FGGGWTDPSLSKWGAIAPRCKDSMASGKPELSESSCGSTLGPTAWVRRSTTALASGESLGGGIGASSAGLTAAGAVLARGAAVALVAEAAGFAAVDFAMAAGLAAVVGLGGGAFEGASMQLTRRQQGISKGT